MEQLEKKIGYSFKNKELLQTALTHSSFANERKGMGCECYERLEFLGDSILGYVTAEFLYNHRSHLPEGRMTKLRAELVCEMSLFKTAEALELGKFMRLGRGEERTGGRRRVSVLSDMVEAIIAALYLDSGIDEARCFIMENVLNDVEITASHRSDDYKTELQELIQRKPDQHIVYALIGETGPDHMKEFRFSVSVNGEELGTGSGRTKKEAEQMAAKKALEELRA